MNVIDLIKNQIEQISQSEKSIFLDSILIHLERAEHYYKLGENDSDYYNDVIYRTNQAFEGGLKEAYKVLANKNQTEVISETPFKIEKYLEENGVFKERVLELFRNYRSEWRNKSTHDSKLFFDNNEAFIAINNVSSFTYLLMKQIIEKITFDNEEEKIRNSERSIIETKKEGLRVAVGIYEIVTQFLTDTINLTDLKTDKLLEVELIGFLKANFNQYLSFAKISTDVKLKDQLRPDFLIELGGQKLILEIKKYNGVLKKESLISQLFTYLKFSNIQEGIVLAIDSNRNFDNLKVEEFKVNAIKMRIIYN